MSTGILPQITLNIDYNEEKGECSVPPDELIGGSSYKKSDAEKIGFTLLQ